MVSQTCQSKRQCKVSIVAGLYFDDPELSKACDSSSVLDVSNMLEYLAFCDDFSYGTYSDSILNAIVTHLCHRGYGQLSELSKSKALETPLRNKDYNHAPADDEIGIGEQSGKEPIPHDDTDRIDGQFLVNVIKGPIFPYQDSRCPPFRFGIEFTNLNQLGAGVKLVSKRAYYAGSYWQSISTDCQNNVPKLGIYLQRVTEEERGWVADESGLWEEIRQQNRRYRTCTAGVTKTSERRCAHGSNSIASSQVNAIY
ncbi:hypothetical protein BSLG_006464 [Batrachochytrium salamandrivorans]|nr:hypothetical protein BSLG_006464 [Batrachochytrium salamandrivorans]